MDSETYVRALVWLSLMVFNEGFFPLFLGLLLLIISVISSSSSSPVKLLSFWRVIGDKDCPMANSFSFESSGYPAFDAS